MLKDENISKPFFLSGGIAPEDAGAIQQFQQHGVAKDLFALDINSRFEVSSGIKDIAKVRGFISSFKISNNNSILMTPSKYHRLKTPLHLWRGAGGEENTVYVPGD